MHDTTQKREVLAVLQSATIVPCYELVRVTHRFSEYVRALRSEGHVIKLFKERQPNGKWHTAYSLERKNNAKV